VTLAITEAGQGPVVVLLHAFPCNRELWNHQIEPLAHHGWRVVAPDLPGFGGSPVATTEPGLDAMARAVLAEMDRRDIDRFVVGGLSMGGYVAMAILRAAPERVAALILIDTKSGDDAPAARQNRLDMADRVLAAGSSAELVESVVPNLLGATTKGGRPEVVATVNSWVSSTSPEGVAWAQRAMAARPDSGRQLALFHRPALIVVGDEDVISPMVDQQIMADLLPRSELVVIPAAGHLSAIEAPEAVTAALLGFTSSLRPPFEGG
jgi:pimeloyl-ACP methyl ester carboxylesterase